MAAGRESYAKLGEVLGESLAGARNVYELAQRHGLVPTGKRGSSVDLNVSQLTSLCLAFAITPRNAIGESVPEWRQMPPRETYGWSMTPYKAERRQHRGYCFSEVSIFLDEYRERLFPDLAKGPAEGGPTEGGLDIRYYQVLPGATLGAALDSFVDYVSRPEAIRFRQALRRASWHLTLSSTGVARVAYEEEGVTFSSSFHAPDFSLERPALVRQATFGFAAIDALADLWADTKARTQGSLTISSPATPESENAAPGRAAPSNTSLRSNTPEGTHHAQTSGLDNHDLTARVCVPSRELDSKAGPPRPWSRSHERVSDHHATA